MAELMPISLPSVLIRRRPITHIDGCVRLNEGFHRTTGFPVFVAVQPKAPCLCTYDTGCYRGFQVQRITDGQYPLTDSNFIGVAVNEIR